MPVSGQHEPVLVLLSLLIAAASSFGALDHAGRMRAATGWPAIGWLASASLLMGGGTWAMHLVGMLALHLPTKPGFDPALCLLSLALPVACTAGCFWAYSRTDWKRAGFLVSGTLMGVGILAMHHVGLAALTIDGPAEFDPYLVGASALISVLASLFALYLASVDLGLGWRLAAASVLAAAVSGMHYVGMEGLSVICRPANPSEMAAQTAVAVRVASATFSVLALAALASSLDRRASTAAAREAEALRASEERYRSLYRHTPLPLHSLGPDGSIEQVSDAWLELLGHRRDDVVGRPLTEFMGPDSAAQRRDRDWPAMLKEAELSEREATFLRSDGEPVEVLLSASVERDARGAFLRSVEGLVDVTDRKRAEQALRQAQKMEAVGQLTGGIAHDFNNLLMVVGGGLDMIERGRASPQLMGGMRHSVERATALTRQLLTFSRRQSLNPEVVEPAALLPRLRTILSHSLRPGVDLAMSVEPGTWRAEVDAGEFELAVLNLVLNARDAMPDGGTVRVEARNEVLDGRNEARLRGEFVAVAVSDSGHGMDAETMARIFEPFFTTKEPGKGTGLGLSQVYGLAGGSGGMVTVRSRPGEGATFTIHLPRTRKPMPAPPPGAAEARAREEDRGLVLLVEDTPSVATVATTLLHELGYDVVQAADADEALSRLEETRGIRAVFSDVVMPGPMNGIALAREVRRRRPGMPVLLATGYSRESERSVEFPVLRKPYQASELDIALAQAIEDERVPARLHA